MENLKEYEGIPLKIQEYNTIRDIEKNLGRPIPSSTRTNFISGFVAENGSIIFLGIDHEKLKKIPPSIQNLTKLQILNLSYLKLKTLPEEIGLLSNLVRLNLDNNQIKELPESIGKLSRLEHLDLAYNNLSNLPNSFGNLTNLHKLILTKNTIDIELNFKNLKKVYKKGCEIERKTAFKWTGAKIQNYLVNSGKSQEELFDDLFQMDDLLSFHDLCSSMHMVDDDVELQWKSKDSERTKWEEDEVFTDGRVERVQQEYEDYSWAMFYQDVPLVIDDYEVLVLLESILNMPVPVVDKAKMNFGFVAEEGRIIELGLYYTGIVEIPEALVLLKELQLLDLGKNNITLIPDWISYLGNLKSLNLEQNQLYSLPVELGELENLSFLDLSHNNLISLPNTIENLFGLQNLNLQDNTLNFNQISEILEQHRRRGCNIETTRAFKLLNT